MNVLNINRDVFVAAARVTVAFVLLLISTLLWQGLSKIALERAARSKKEKFDRYQDRRMLPKDRAVGNLIEWSMPFIVLFWLSMVLTNGSTVTIGWVYVGCRALYPIIAANNGIGSMGAKAPILLSTIPAYVALVLLALPVFRALA